MITRGLLLRKAIDQWVFEREKLRSLLLTTDEWKMPESLGKILTVFTQVTLEMPRSGTPTLPFVLPIRFGLLPLLVSLNLPCTTKRRSNANSMSLQRCYIWALVWPSSKKSARSVQNMRASYLNLSSTPTRGLRMRRFKVHLQLLSQANPHNQRDLALPVNKVLPLEPEFKRFYDASSYLRVRRA
ncbi:hypothetical protein DFH09DRAFT_273044 [Mycena vulgaris]|nr:hypothetical protein DFH09DRAFT_273044 [Mycena vulgaris]